MPARRFDDEPFALVRHDVAGIDSSATPEFVRHVGLSLEAKRCRRGEALSLIHMSPPLNRGELDRVDCAGTVGLTADEALQINVFIDEAAFEYEAGKVDARRQYVVSPHVTAVRSPDGTTIHRRFSCAGFVIEAYREADIDLLQTDGDVLPLVSLEVLVLQYPNLERMLSDASFRQRIGIPGDGPWPVVLAGHVMNSLARAPEAIRAAPYFAQPGDEFFPTKRPREFLGA